MKVKITKVKHMLKTTGNHAIGSFLVGLGRVDCTISLRRRKAFTLIELLVVISIISLLIAMLLPSIEKARQSGEQAVCAANLKSFGVALNAYVNEWDSWLPNYEAWYDDHNRSKLVVSEDGNWYWKKNFDALGSILNSYLDSAGDPHSHMSNTPQGVICPSFLRSQYSTGKWGAGAPSGGRQFAEDQRTNAAVHWQRAAYGYNSTFLGYQWSVSGNAKNWRFRKIDHVRFPSNIISDGDTGFSIPGGLNGNHFPEISRTAGLYDHDLAVSEQSDDPLPDHADVLRMPIGNRHLVGANAVCLDGHVEWQLQVEWHLRENDHRWREENANFYPFRFK